MRLILFALASTSFAAYARAIARFFARPDGMPRRMQLISVSGSVAAAVHVLWLAFGPLARSPLPIVSLVVYAAGLLLFAWTRRHTASHPPALAFSSAVPTRLFTTGPYAILRHPFYVSYSLTWLAGWVAAGSGVVLAPAAWMIALYVVAARQEERDLLMSVDAAAYRRYLRRT